MINEHKFLISLAKRRIGFIANYFTSKNGKYGVSFVDNVSDLSKVEYDDIVPRVIWCFWTGDNRLTSNREKCLQSLRENAGCNVQFVTRQNLNDFIVSGTSLHPSYEYLSCVHKADYLRCYFMYHHGGGYSDVKSCNNSWEASFKALENDHYKFALGYPEIHPLDVAYINSFYDVDNVKYLNRCMLFHYNYIIGNGAYIFKPKSSMAKCWLDELHKRLDIVYDDLKAHPGNIWGDNDGYPLSWNSILGQVIHPLAFIYRDYIIRTNNIKPVLENYR